MANGDIKLIASSSTIVTTDATNTCLNQVSVPIGTTVMFTVQVVAQNTQSFGNVYGYAATFLVNCSGSAATIQGNGSVPVELQPSSFPLLAGVTADTSATSFRVFVSGSATQRLRWASVISGIQLTQAVDL